MKQMPKQRSNADPMGRKMCYMYMREASKPANVLSLKLFLLLVGFETHELCLENERRVGGDGVTEATGT